MQVDFFASHAESAPPIKTRNRRKSVQDSKEQLIEQIRASCARPPA
jgi:peptide subunit release factor 1 (eRF1)